MSKWGAPDDATFVKKHRDPSFKRQTPGKAVDKHRQYIKDLEEKNRCGLTTAAHSIKPLSPLSTLPAIGYQVEEGASRRGQ